MGDVTTMINGAPYLVWVIRCAGGCGRSIFINFDRESCATVSNATARAVGFLGFEMLDKDNLLYCAGCAREATKCPVCGEYIEPTATRKGRKYCSRKCANIMQRIKAGNILCRSPKSEAAAMCEEDEA